MPVCQYYMHIGYLTRCSPTAAPIGTIPVTPVLFTLKICIPLPVVHFVHTPLTPYLQPSIATHIFTSPDAWADPLWHNIQPHAHMDTLWHAIVNWKLICLISNAVVSSIGQGMCAWVIWAANDLWSSEDYIPSLAIDMYSGLAKAYSIHTVLSFLHQYICFFH